MSDTVADFMLKRLHAWGVRRIFGFPGDGISGLVAAIGRDKTIDFVQTRHEEAAAFMACAHAKWTGEVGVCVATSGPGAIHLLNGLYDAKLDHQPVLAIVGQQARAALGGSYQQEVDLGTLFKDVAGDYVHTMMVPAQTRHLIDRAMRVATSYRTVTAIIVPNDVQELEAVKEPPRAHGTVHSGMGWSAPVTTPLEPELARAADALNAGKKVAILAGAGALQATDEVMQVADLLGAGVAKALLGKAALPDDLPYVTGQIGLLGTEPSDWMMRHCDTFLMIGSRFPYSEFLPAEGQARGVQIDRDPKMLSIRYPMEINLTGDAARHPQRVHAASRAQAGPLVARGHREARRRLVGRRRRPRQEVGQADQPRARLLGSLPAPARQLHHRRGLRLLGELVRPRAARPPRHEGVALGHARHHVPGRALRHRPAKFAYPDRVAIGFVGDGAMQMLGINGLITIGKYWREWADPRLGHRDP